MKKIIIFVLVLFTNLSIKAQYIEGMVLELLDDSTTQPIFQANIFWEGTSIGTVSKEDGSYLIQEPPSYPASLNVSFIGYSFHSKEVINDQFLFYLKKSLELSEVEINDKKNTTSISTINSLNIQTLSEGEIQKAACCNLSECFETNNVVDVNFTDGISGVKKIKMLGLEGKYIQITNELMPLTKGLQRSFGLSYIPGSWIESIQIIQGAGSVVNGFESFTGQINIEYFKPEINKLKLNIYANNSGKIESNVILTKKKGNWRSNLFSHISYFDREIDHYGFHNNSDQISNRDGFIDMPKFKQFSLLNRWKYYGSDKYRFQINLRAVLEERNSGQMSNEDIINPYIVSSDNKIVQFYGKLGKIYNDKRSLGTQFAVTLHNQDVQIGNYLYDAKQESFFINIVKQNQLMEKNLLKYGLSSSTDIYSESLFVSSSPFSIKSRVDVLTGFFAENSFTSSKLNIITGIRADYYNVEKNIYYSPRIHLKYNPNEQTVVRVSAGKSFRISNVINENIFYLASSRNIIIEDNIRPEEAYNYGLNIAYCFYLQEKEGNINFSLYNTFFSNQVVVNIEDKDEISFSNLVGNSQSISLNIGIDFQIINNLSIRSSYKIDHSVSTFNGVEKDLPLQSSSRGLFNIAYNSISEDWYFDITSLYIGSSRIPENIISDNELSPSFFLFNCQITRKLKDFDVYLGAENISNYTQDNPIIDAQNPFGDDFDASLIWGPLMGRSIYIGFRYKLD